MEEYTVRSQKVKKKQKKPLKSFERIFHFLHDILDIYNSFRYSGTSEPVNCNFLVIFQMVMQIYNPFGPQEFYQWKKRRNLSVRWCYAFLLVVLKFYLLCKCCSFQKRMILQPYWHLDLVAETY